MLKTLFGIFWSILKIPVIIIGCLAVGFFIAIGAYLIKLYITGKRLPAKATERYKKPSHFQRLGHDLPKQIATDMMNADPDAFGYKGCIIFTGRQGNGKTIAMTEFAMRVKKEYPQSKLITNYAVSFQDAELKHWRQLIDFKNGKLGVMCLMDELQNWFSSNASKNFPPEMLQVITQNRKNLRLMCGTAQNFYLLAKAIRSQCTEVRECRTFFGCLTIVRRKEPILDSDGNVKDWNRLGTYYFVHSDELRSYYDTYKVIENLAESGFKDSADVTATNYESGTASGSFKVKF